jgi:hypothetical protein
MGSTAAWAAFVARPHAAARFKVNEEGSGRDAPIGDVTAPTDYEIRGRTRL